MPQPAFLLQNHLLLAGAEIDINQAAFGLGKVKRAEFTPVGERLPVALFNFDANQFCAI
ncbi:hypothetical protein D3C85_1360680 [compost metagenome]